MFAWGPATRIYLAAGVTDMRKGFEGLYGLVRDSLQCEPLSGHIFVFSNRQRNRLKLLFWDNTGLSARGRSAPRPKSGTVTTFRSNDLLWIENELPRKMVAVPAFSATPIITTGC
jgi:hypothetical protein